VLCCCVYDNGRYLFNLMWCVDERIYEPANIQEV
jgi:hypothetical protein